MNMTLEFIYMKKSNNMSYYLEYKCAISFLFYPE